MIWYFIRHGEIESNIRKVYAGWSDEALTEVGIRQAERAGAALKKKGIGVLYCSPLKRAVQTAEIIGEAIGKTPVSDEHFREMRLGPWEGLREDEVARRFPEGWRLWNTRPADLKLDGRETLGELQGRVLEGIRRLSADYADSRIAIVSHVAIIRVMKLYAEGRDLNDYKKVPVSNGEIFKVDGKLVRC